MKSQAAKKAPKVVWVSRPETQKGSLKRIAGSNSDAFNNIVITQALSSLWTAHSDEAGLDAQYQAATAAMMGIKPADEIEGMLAAQMIATHNAAMECFRRSMIKTQTFEGAAKTLTKLISLSGPTPPSLRR